MATNIETMWVSDPAQLQSTVQTLVSQGGVVQSQSETEVQVFLKKKMNVLVLIIGLLLCLLPGLAYLIWFSTADQSQQITVKIGSPASIRTEKEHWYDQQAVDGASPGTVPPPTAPTVEMPIAPDIPGQRPANPIPPPPPLPGSDPGLPPQPPQGSLG